MNSKVDVNENLYNYSCTTISNLESDIFILSNIQSEVVMEAVMNMIYLG